jgi:hypothetical protein
MANREASRLGSTLGFTSSMPPPIIDTHPIGTRDLAWKYAYQGLILGIIICIRCINLYHGGINCLKYHLADITHHDAKPCINTIEEIKREMNYLLALAKAKKLQKEKTSVPIATSIIGGHGPQVQPKSDEDMTCQGIVGSLCGPRIQSKLTSTSSTSSS